MKYGFFCAKTQLRLSETRQSFWLLFLQEHMLDSGLGHFGFSRQVRAFLSSCLQSFSCNLYLLSVHDLSRLTEPASLR